MAIYYIGGLMFIGGAALLFLAFAMGRKDKKKNS